MIYISNAATITGSPLELTIPSLTDLHVDARGLTIFPGLIDPHVHFRTPGMEYKEDWRTAAAAAIHGGYTTVFDMPNTLPPTVTATLLQEKKALIDAQLHDIGIPLRYQLFFGADKNHFDEIPAVKDAVIGIKVFMGCSTGNLVIDDDQSLQAVFEIAAANDLLVAVHAEDEQRLCERKLIFKGSKDYQDHSVIRDAETARIAVEKAITLARSTGARLYILHVSTEQELALIKQAKQEGLPVYAETTPHHLFLNTTNYAALQGKAVVNPPLRGSDQNEILWKALVDNVIDTIGSDHAPHTIDEKAKPYGSCPSGMPGIETTLPLLLTAYHQGRLSLERIVQLTSSRAQTLFRLPQTSDIVLVDLNKKATVVPTTLKTKCAWSPFAGLSLQGWPVYTIVNGKCFQLT
jgi:dihydroorotase